MSPINFFSSRQDRQPKPEPETSSAEESEGNEFARAPFSVPEGDGTSDYVDSEQSDATKLSGEDDSELAGGNEADSDTESEDEDTESPSAEEKSEPKPEPEPYDFERSREAWLNDVKFDEGADSATIVELSHSHPGGLARLYAGTSVLLSNLVREQSALVQGIQQARALLRTSDLQAEQYGVSTIYLVVGTARWLRTSADSQHSDSASTMLDLPVFLRPINLIPQNNDYLIRQEGSMMVSPLLVEALRAEGIRINPVELYEECLGRHGFTPGPALEMLRAAAAESLSRFSAHPDLCLSLALHPYRMAVQELKDSDTLQQSKLVRALAGEPAAVENLAAHLPAGLGLDLDPDAEHGVGDLDPQGAHVVESVRAGRSLVVDAGPGTEAKSLTASLLVDVALSGRSVVYASGDASRAYAVSGLLEEYGLRHFAADLTDTRDWRRHLRADIRSALRHLQDPLPAPRQYSSSEHVFGSDMLITGQIEDLDYMAQDESGEASAHLVMGSDSKASEMVEEAGSAAPSDTSVVSYDTQGLRDELRSVRETMSHYVSQLHEPRDPWGISPYQCLQVLADLIGMHPAPRTKIRFDESVCQGIFNDGGEQARAALDEAAAVGYFASENSDQTWFGAQIHDSETAHEVIDAIRDVKGEALDSVRFAMSRTSTETGLKVATNLAQWREQLGMLDGVREVLDIFLPYVFESPVDDMIVATASRQWRREHNRHMKRSMRRRLTKQARDLVRPGTAISDLHKALTRVQDEREIWGKFSEAGGWPTLPNDLDAMRADTEEVVRQVKVLQAVLPETDLISLPVAQLSELLERLDATAATAYGLPALHSARGTLIELGLLEFADDLVRRKVAPEMIVPELDLAWWASVLSHIMHQERGFEALDGPTLDYLTAQLRQLDRAHIDSLQDSAWRLLRHRARKVARAHAGAVTGLIEQFNSGVAIDMADLVYREPWLWELTPIRIVPAVLAPSVLGDKVDVVVLDRIEETQMGQLIPLLSRAKQVVVLGDLHQKGESAWKRFAQLLPHLPAQPSRTPHHQAVASLLSRHGYQRSVAPVPTPRTLHTVNLVQVNGRGMPAMGSSVVESSSAEVKQAVEMVLDHALAHPDQSLAVAALNAKHASYIREAVISALANNQNPAVDEFFRTDKAEPFAVVDPDNAAGVERDRVILSVGYAKTPHGRMMHDLGVLSQSEGLVKLAGLLDMVRTDLTLLIGFKLDDLDLTRMTAPGESLLFDLYRVAEGGGLQSSAGWETVGEAPDRLLVDLAERLYRMGIEVVPNLGVEGGYRIPLALGHPDVPGELLVAVLTDDAAYVSEPSLRVRDRHEVERLEANGWLVKRVFSTAAFADPQGEAESLMELVLDAVDLRLGRQTGAWVPDSSAEGVPAAEAPESFSELSETVVEQPEVEESPEQPEQPELTEPASVKLVEDVDAEIQTPVTMANPVIRQRGPRPGVATGLPLAAYSDEQLDEMLAWVATDEVPRTVEQFVHELHHVLGLTRTGRQVDAVLGYVIKRNSASLNLLGESGQVDASVSDDATADSAESNND